MSGRGRNAPRTPKAEEIAPDSPEGRQLGLSARVQGHPSPIPGGAKHTGNAPAIRHTVPTPPSDREVSTGNAHGVIPGSHTNADRASMQRGPNDVHSPHPQHIARPERPHPIPVYVVEDHNDEVIRSAAPRSITVPGNTAEPVHLCGLDTTRTEVMLLNESTTQDVRFAQRPTDLNNGGGALLPYPANSYVTIKTQDHLYALSTSGTAATVSVIQIFERDM
jgi:hypothetical protein